jgi:hypothetical protein
MPARSHSLKEIKVRTPKLSDVPILGQNKEMIKSTWELGDQTLKKDDNDVSLKFLIADSQDCISSLHSPTPIVDPKLSQPSAAIIHKLA